MNRAQRRRALRTSSGEATAKPAVDPSACKHSKLVIPAFDAAAACRLSAEEVRRQWPRLEERCPDCLSLIIGYASIEHYIFGDW